MKSGLVYYSKILRAHPGKTQVLTTGLIMMSGDIISQKFIERSQFFDTQRAARFFLMGILYRGPVWYVWFRLLDRRFGAGNAPRTVIKKLLSDQILFRPTSLFCFLGLLSVLHRRPWVDVKKTIWADYVSVLKTGYMFWPVVQLINYGWVPCHFRLIYFSSLGVVWNTYLSWKVNRSKHPVEVLKNVEYMKTGRN
ncbi:hypothetical protein HPB47_027537 [Ixodes persulcatus]|uniref:Uncharacterized protein n=1 Tax=Ixodes persulcatus TaxID=34615 RepID=A0AC60PW51_IXOPE|nr:hypothetical protein HPB47_027537 [Ixodes persulcatus]